jgi:hypothetical protein
MKPIRTFQKDPDSILDYRVDWSEWLQSGEAIVSFVPTVPAGLTASETSFEFDSCTIWLAGGTATGTYDIGYRIQTNMDRVDERTIRIICVER